MPQNAQALLVSNRFIFWEKVLLGHGGMYFAQVGIG